MPSGGTDLRSVAPTCVRLARAPNRQRRKSGPNFAQLSLACLWGVRTCLAAGATSGGLRQTVNGLSRDCHSDESPAVAALRRQTLEVCLGSGCLANAVKSCDHHEMVVTPYGIYLRGRREKHSSVRKRTSACEVWGRDGFLDQQDTSVVDEVSCRPERAQPL